MRLEHHEGEPGDQRNGCRTRNQASPTRATPEPKHVNSSSGFAGWDRSPRSG